MARHFGRPSFGRTDHGEDGALRDRFRFLFMFPIGLLTKAKANIVVIPASPQQIMDAFPKRKGSGVSAEREDESNVMLTSSKKTVATARRPVRMTQPK